MARAKRSGIIRRKARSRIAKLTVEGKLNTVVFVTNMAASDFIERF